MKKNKVIKILILTILLTVFIGTIIFQVNAFDIGELNGTNPSGNGSVEISDLGNKIITVVTIIGSVVSVIVLIILGIKYMLGSVDEKAEYKKTLLPYIIGATLVFAASSIASIIYNLAIKL